MLPENLVEGEKYVVSHGVEKDGEEHPQLDPGDIVTLVNGDPDSDGEVYVTATAADDGATIGAWVKTEYLITREEADRWIEENCTCEEGSDNDPDGWVSFQPHPQFPDLPSFETLPLGYALGVVQFIKDLGQRQDPNQVLLAQYLNSRGFPTV